MLYDIYLSPTSLGRIISRSAMLLQKALFHSFYGFIPYIYIYIYTYIHTYTYHIYIYYIFLHPFIDGHLGSFHVLDIVNNTTLNIGVHASFQIRVFVFSIYVPKNGIVGSYDSSVFSFRRPTILLSIKAAPIYIPTNSVG